MTPGDWFGVYASGGAALIMALFWLYGRMQFKDGWEAHRQHEIDRRHQRALGNQRQPTTLVDRSWMAYQPGRHAPWQPRLTATRALAFNETGPAALTAPITHGPGTDSGALRGLVAGTDLYIDRMRAREAAYRGELIS